MSIIYGIDTSMPYSAVDVRDAIIECFTQAHKAVLAESLKEVDKGLTDQERAHLERLNIAQTVRHCFKKSEGDFEKPNKEVLVKVCQQLAEFAEKFRAEHLIQEHYNQILELIDGCEE